MKGKIKHISLLCLGSHPLLADKQTRRMLARMLLTVHQQAKTKDIRLRLVIKPVAEVEQICNALSFKHYPFKSKKYVVYH